MRFFSTIFNKIKFLIITVVDLLRYICCFKRDNRRLSTDDIPLSSVGVIPADRCLQISCDDDMSSSVGNLASNQFRNVHDYIKEYREQKYKQMTTEPVEEVATDYFQDMIPDIVEQQKVLINQNEDQIRPSIANSRLSFVPSTTSVIARGNELASWEEMENTGSWNDDDLNTDQILKNDRQLERQRRMMEKKRMEKGRAPFGSKIS